jgi:hypothetical protein
VTEDDPNDAVGRALGGATDADALKALARTLSSSARAAGAGAVASGRWLTDWFIENAPRIPVRDRATLEAHHDGKRGADLAAELVTAASRSSAAVGAAAGALMTAGELAPPAWVTLPIELIVETVAVAAIELKLVAELHEAYGAPVPGGLADRSLALLQAWAERRGVTPATLAKRGGLGDALGRGARDQIVRLVRRRLAGRVGRNLTSLAPLFLGAIAGAELNRRATRSLGEAVVRDLAARPT